MACSCTTKIQIIGNAFRGDTISNPLSELELYEASKLGDWDCVNTNDGVNYNVSTNIEVGNGVDMTVLIIEGKNIIFATGKDFIPNPPCYIKVGSVWTQAEKDLLFSEIGLSTDEHNKLMTGLDESIPDAVLNELLTDHITSGSVGEAILLAWDAAGGRRVIDENTNQEIFYKADNTTEIMRFNLFDVNGNPTSTKVYERVRV